MFLRNEKAQGKWIHVKIVPQAEWESKKVDDFNQDLVKTFISSSVKR